MSVFIKKWILPNLLNLIIFSLQSELDTCKNSTEEETCKRLHHELEKLQEENYRKQMKLQIARQSRHSNASKNICVSQEHKYHASSTPDSPLVFTDDSKAKNAYSFLPQNDIESGSVKKNEEDWLDPEEFEEEHMDALEEGEWDEKLELITPDDFSTAHVWEMEKANCFKQSVSHQKRFIPRYYSEHTIYKSSTNDLTETEAGNVQAPSKISTNEKIVYDRKRPSSLNHIQHSLASPIRKKKVTSAPMDSPDPNLIPRKRPGESIYKAPRTHNLASR